MLPMTEVLISRTMTKTRPDGVQSQCSISFGTPAVNPILTTADRTMYYCPIQLSGLQSNYIYSLSGEDPLAALIASLTFAGSMLGSSVYATQFDEWDASCNFGFPINFPIVLPPDGGGNGQPGGGGGNGNPGAGG